MLGVITNGNWADIMKTAGYIKKRQATFYQNYIAGIYLIGCLKLTKKIISFYRSPALTLLTFFHLLFSTLHT